ncbi:SGF29 tudor-like domain-containing protein [Cytidiella melzeri]|nr:SGF29 tudor-like domain-containing protein [Cytidiella melzeri]
MANRRGPQTRPASSEEIDCWSRASESLTRLSTVYGNQESNETIGRVNRLLLAWPTDDVAPAEGFDNLKNTYKKLTSGLSEIKNNADKEARAIEETIERLDILIALRKASEATPPEKRNKRPRGQSPAAAPAPLVTQPPAVAPAAVTRGVSITVPARSSVGPPAPKQFSREPKARREALAKQLPLQHGRRVAFRQPRDPNKALADATDEGKGEQWILAVVTRCINQDKNRYEVHDPEPQDDGSPGQHYNTTLRALIPLPDLTAPPDSASHLNAYPEFTAGSTVMALYPDTSCFYRAVVIESPKDMSRNAIAAKQMPVPMYKLKFEDDNDQEHPVSAQWVVEWPGGP